MNLPQVAAHTAGIFQAWMGGIADVPAQTPEELALKSSGQGHRDRKGHVAETGHPAAVPIPGQTDPVMWDQCALRDGKSHLDQRKQPVPSDREEDARAVRYPVSLC